MAAPIKESAFYEFISENFQKGTFSSDDIIAIILPLLKTVSAIHNQGKVASLDNISSIYIENGHLHIADNAFEVKQNLKPIQELFTSKSKAFEISGLHYNTTEIGENVVSEFGDKSVSENEETNTKKAIYVKDYGCFEFEFGHHDPVTDIFVLGMILASITLQFDFTVLDDVKRFVEYRKKMYFLNSKINPAIANIILGMTELNRNKRWKDVNEVIEKLKNYRDYDPENEYDLSSLIDSKVQNKKQFIHEKLRNRLFDNSKRNRLLYFQPNLKFLNLTVSSVPQALDYKNIDPNSIFYWNEEISNKISKTSTISLNKYLEIGDNTYIVPTLDKIRLEANKDINEYGFSQLKLVICNLNWFNTKENSSEKIVSPLLLASVTLTKKKGLKDQYSLEFLDSEVEVNPVLANVLKELYDIRLPERIQLSETKIESVYELLRVQVEKNNSGIVLDYIDKPKIKLIYSQAKQILTQFNKRSKKKQAIQDQRSLSYSYQQENFQPYGLELFRNYVFTHASSLEYLINSDIKRNAHFFNENKTIEREFYQLDEGDINPFRWEFDTCNLILGNFNYKKMSLVRDYNQVIESDIESNVFKNLFDSLAQKNFKNELESGNSFTKTFNVVASDPTQNNAVKYSETGESYIIQGPPGTGKSQTIANLIANYVARGKKVLFVCEKRAALDVVFYRLKNQGLDDLCCLIHDSQADKKEFILDLKKTFNDFTASKNKFQAIADNRVKLVREIDNEINKVASFHDFMNAEIDAENNLTIKSLFDVLVSSTHKALLDNLNTLDDKAGLQDWNRNQEVLQKWYAINLETNQSEFFSVHPFRFFKTNVFHNYKNISDLKNDLENSQEILENISERLDFISIPPEIDTFFELQKFLRRAMATFVYFDANMAELLEPNSSIFRSLENDVQTLLKLRNDIEKSAKQYPYWKTNISETDAKNALEIIRKNENSFFNFINSDYKKAKNEILAVYDINKHAVKPSLVVVLENYCAQFEQEEKFNTLKTDFEGKYNLGDLFELKYHTETIKKELDETILKFGEKLEKSERKEVVELKNLFLKVSSSLVNSIENYENLSLSEIENEITAINSKKIYFDLYASFFDEIQDLNPSVIQLLKTKKIPLEHLKITLAERSLEKYYAINYTHKKFNMDMLHTSIQRIKKRYADLLELNGKYIVAKQISNLKELILTSEMSVSGMTADQKEAKKSITEGRKILENEFSKSIRFKSIRDLASSDSGQIIREIKPVWLMSPLSVSDTLPVNENYFDVVIFDEASQITLEEGLVPIYRAKQTIIVGDEMQMPPSNFFGSSSGNQDDLWKDATEEDDDYFSLDADSFLTQGARKFPSIMLGWHYRSKHEALIGFSNASFYDSKLLTIPDLKDHSKFSEPIIVEKVQDAKANLEQLFSKPISYHYIKNGVYNNRSNTLEAQYIANIVREILMQNKEQSIGIVAFSMEQQNEIETAIEALCIDDKVFENLLEEEYKRIENNQFVGLFVKNLENVQGDERDIIIMSTCFGYNPNGKMLMNFGPINKRGGEKRLNVIFSRAKKSMCVVSSIKYFDIKNEYNEGANYFRKYLQYAELVSLGQVEAANNVLNSINNKNNTATSSIIADQIQDEISKMGYSTVKNVGQSKFKCHLGIKKTDEDEEFVLGIMIDDHVHYANDDILEQYLLRPEILKNNGWNVCQIYIKDWIENKPRVLKMIGAALKNEYFFEEEEIESLNTDIETIEVENQNQDLNGNVVFERYLNTSNGSNKFWEISQQDKNIIVQYGRIGTKGQKMVKTFDSEDNAIKEKRKLIAQKLAKEYFKES
ncbi:AAA domain-containing protein [Flavobacterium quisquiliarum]|uniref:AAA domain-containing protein n=1 Tax=Flavobacterium quisquiliarum TaxID=1834436 RepID=A0ABV8WDM1_9FLAO|nr:AAA domain-containing protein [Flavobacterium quisquiliarum]MBW1658286.1 WGR domain-containing protein [Flavobacterium quisquiliarum]NWL02185.1 DNA helicase [Flavobacterium collinsii]